MLLNHRLSQLYATTRFHTHLCNLLGKKFLNSYQFIFPQLARQCSRNQLDAPTFAEERQAAAVAGRLRQAAHEEVVALPTPAPEAA